jgi:hypothetical protein
MAHVLNISPADIAGIQNPLLTDLDVGTRAIISTGNNPITLAPGGTGPIQVSTDGVRS